MHVGCVLTTKSLIDGFNKSVESKDLLATTIIAKEREAIAHNLGMGDGADLESSGLMARSNSAVANLNNLQSRKDKDKRFEDLIYEQMRKSLEAINAEMDWLEDQIKIEETAIQQNNSDIDFIRTLDEDNIMGADGKLREDVNALLKKHGHSDTGDLAADEVMLILQAIETDLHNDNIIRQDRIDVYQARHSQLRSMAGDMMDRLPDVATPELREEIEATASRQPYEVNYRVMKEAKIEQVADAIEAVEKQQFEQNVSSAFTLG